MTEWNAADYERISGLQLAMAEEVLALLDLNGARRRILDVPRQTRRSSATQTP